MAEKKYEVVVKGMTVFGASHGQILELDEEIAQKYVDGRYIEPSRKHNADVKGEPTPLEVEKPSKQPKAKPKKQPAKADATPVDPAPKNAEVKKK